MVVAGQVNPHRRNLVTAAIRVAGRHFQVCSAGQRPASHHDPVTTSPATGAGGAPALPDYAPFPRSALGPALNDNGYHVGRVERNLHRVTDGTYQSAFLATGDGVVLFDAPVHWRQPPPSRGRDRPGRRRAQHLTHLVYSHHHADHAGASSLFGCDVVRIGHEETRRLMRRDNDPARPVPEVTFADRQPPGTCGRR